MNGTGVQLFAPDYAFALEQSVYDTITDTYVVQYNQPADITDALAGGTILGASFLHDFERMSFDGDVTQTPSFDQFGAPSSFGLPKAPHARLVEPAGAADRARSISSSATRCGGWSAGRMG